MESHGVIVTLQILNTATISHLPFLIYLPIIFAIYRRKNVVKMSNVMCPGVLVLVSSLAQNPKIFILQ